MTHKICFKAVTKEISVLPLASEVPVGFTNIGNYIHDAGGDPLGSAVNHVLYHHIRDALYQVGVQDMAYIDITFTSEVGAPPIVCAFPLDATLEEVVSLGFSSKAVMTNNDQTGTYTYQGGLAETYAVCAAPAGVLATTSLIGFSTGNKMFEVGFAVDALVGTNTPLACITPTMQCSNNAGTGGFRIRVTADATGNYITTLKIINGGETIVYESAATPTHPATIAVGASAGVLSAWADGAPLVLLATTMTTDDMFPILVINEEPGLDAANAGRTASVTIRTDASTFLHSYPGWTDPCGNSAA